MNSIQKSFFTLPDTSTSSNTKKPESTFLEKKSWLINHMNGIVDKIMWPTIVSQNSDFLPKIWAGQYAWFSIYEIQAIKKNLWLI